MDTLGSWDLITEKLDPDTIGAEEFYAHSTDVKAFGSIQREGCLKQQVGWPWRLAFEETLVIQI